MHVKSIVPHPSNRDGEGLVADRAQSRVKVIKKGGMSLKTIRPNCVGIEDHPVLRHIAKFGMDLTSMSEKFAKYEEAKIRGGTLGAGHATHGFAQVHDEVPCDIPEISENGRMSRLKCFEDPNIKHTVEVGLEFDMLDYRIEVAFPIIPHIIQSAFNVVQQVSEDEHWHQMLMKVVNEAKTYPNINWKLVKKAVLKTQPPRPEDVPDMADYVAKWGGLPSGTFIKQISELCSVFVPSNERIVTGGFLKGLADLKFPPNQMPADFIGAAVFVHYNSSVGIVDGVSRYLKASDFSDIFGKGKEKKYESVILANQILQRMRTLLEENPCVPKHRRLYLLRGLQIACVEAVLGHTKVEPRPLDKIAADCANQFAALMKRGPRASRRPRPNQHRLRPSTSCLHSTWFRMKPMDPRATLAS